MPTKLNLNVIKLMLECLKCAAELVTLHLSCKDFHFFLINRVLKKQIRNRLNCLSNDNKQPTEIR